MFFTRRFYVVIAAIAVVLASGVLFLPLFVVGQCLLVVLAVCVALEALVLYALADVSAERSCAERFSLGDDNEVSITVSNPSALTLRLSLVDELPQQLQWRDFSLQVRLPAGVSRRVSYRVRPYTRGEYSFGHVLVFASTVVRLVEYVAQNQGTQYPHRAGACSKRTVRQTDVA